MSTNMKIIEAAVKLAMNRPVDQIHYSDVAREAEVHWTTVRRHLGSKENMKEMLVKKQAEYGLTNTDTRTRIIDAGMKIFAKHGYSSASLDQVAAAAGVSKGAVYWHFSSKSDLYVAICQRNFRQQAKRLPSQAKDIFEAEDTLSALSAWLKRQFQGCLQHPESPFLFFEFLTTSRDDTVRNQLRQLFEELYRQVGDMFQRLQSKGLIRGDVEPASLAVFVQTVLNGLMLSWITIPHEMDLNIFVEDAARVLWSGLAPETAEGNE